MENPFESGHIKNYLLLYASIVVIMVLFFIASSLFHDVASVDKKSFNSDVSELAEQGNNFEIKLDANRTNKFKLLPQDY